MPKSVDSVDEVRPEGARIKVAISPKGEIEITGNRLGLEALSRILRAVK